jgi:hypothetical protein
MLISAGANGIEPVLIFLLFGALVAAIVIIAAIQAAKRRQAWQALADRLGCSFSADDPFDIPSSYPQSLFNKGRAQKAYNVLSGQIKGAELSCFEYRYTEGSGKNRHTHHFTCLMLMAPIPFQPLFIRPESFFDRIGEFFGLDDIDFESDEFSRRFFVTCPDKKFAYDIIHSRTMELLLECGNISVEAQGNSILFFYSGSLRVPDQVEPLIQRGLRFLELIPHYLIEQARGANA